MAKCKEVAQMSAKEAYMAAYKLGIEYRNKVSSLLDSCFGTWDGFYTEPGETPSKREIEDIVFDRIFNPTLEYLKTRTFEEVEMEIPIS